MNLLMSSVHFGRKPKRKRVYVSLNRTSQNHYVSEPNRTGTGRNHALSLFSYIVYAAYKVFPKVSHYTNLLMNRIKARQ